MIDLRERLQELADAGARHGTTPGPAAAIRRGRQRRRRIAGAAAVGLAVALAVGTGALGRLAGQPDLPAITPPTSLSPLIDLDLRGDVHAPAAETAISTLSSEVGRCPGGLGAEGTLVGYFRSAELRRLVVIGAKRPASGETTVCWAVGVFELDGSGTLSPPVKPSPIATPLTANVQRSTGYGALYGQVDPRAVRVLVRFRERPSVEVRVIQAEFQLQVNLYVALFQPGAVPVEVTALDAAGRRLGGCALATAADLPRCPEH